MDIATYHASTDPEKRPATFLTGHELKQHCYTRTAAGSWARCLQQYPCNAHMINVLGMGRCYVPMPIGVRTAYLHFVRNPISVVVSAYLYHTQQPPPEDWIWRFNVSEESRRAAQHPARQHGTLPGSMDASNAAGAPATRAAAPSASRVHTTLPACPPHSHASPPHS